MAVSGKLTGRAFQLSIQRLCMVTPARYASTESANSLENANSLVFEEEKQEPQNTHKISKAMQSYLERARKYNTFYNEQLADYEIGKRHLANMMGQDPEFFTQKDIDAAIEYLFPSGLFEPRARPLMRHPDEVFPKRKDAEFDESGRPFHHLFYTVYPNYYHTLNGIVEKLRKLDKYEDKQIREGKHVVEKKDFLIGEDWVSAEKLSTMLLEKLNDFHRQDFVKTIDRLASHAYGHMEKDFINGFRTVVASQKEALEAPELVYDDNGRPFMTADGRRKSCWSKATVTGNGSGKFTVNGADYKDAFLRQQDREQLLFPLHFTGLMDRVDVQASVEGGGPSGQSGAIRVAISRALRSFVDKDMLEKMRIAGLLTIDPRIRERKKPGQEGARRKYTWKRR